MRSARGAGQEDGEAILAEARRILAERDETALAPSVSLTRLAEAVADTFDLSFTADRILDMLAADRRRVLEDRRSTGRSAEVPEGGGIEVWLPEDIAERLKGIADHPVEAIRALLDFGQGLPELGSEERCRRRCSPRISLADPGGWACSACGLAGRVDQPANPLIEERLADQKDRVRDLHALAAEVYEAWGAGGRVTVADGVARRLLGGRADRDRLKRLLGDLMEAGVIEDAPGPRGGAGYRVLDEPPDWIADAMADRRQRQQAEARGREERAAVIRRALDEGLIHTTPGGRVVEVAQSERGLELQFPTIPSWELREAMKRQGQCRWDGRRRRWCRTSPVATVEPWLAAALDVGATIEPYGTADPDAEDWAHPDWPD